MSEFLDAGKITAEERGDVRTGIVISQPVSDDEESSDDEYFDSCEFLEQCSSDSICKEDLGERPNKSTSSTTRADEQNSLSGESVEIEKCYDVLDYFSKDVHTSSEESKNSAEDAFIIEYRAGEEGNIDYVDVEVVDSVEEEDIAQLMQRCRVDHYSARYSKVYSMYAKCKMLFERDYVCEAIDNSGGSLCSHYPERLIIPVAEKLNTACSDSLEERVIEFNTELYSKRVKCSISCRLRKRFVAPVIMFNKKFICRAGTITVRKTAVFETAKTTSPPKNQNVKDSPIKRTARNIARTVIDVSNRGRRVASQLFAPSSIRKLRNVDAQIMRDLNVQYVCDLMIEDRKKYKHIRLSSSEKINPSIYCDCNIEQMPYPGCQFFKRYHDAKRVPEGLIFNWSRPDANTEMKFTEDPCLTFPDVEWEMYKTWDLIELTKNYMKILLFYLAKGSGGLLVHCVSGWDRTPLFISMLRVSLWADGIIHESLNCREMAYLTLAYDWYLFGHDLPSRLKKKQEIMHFCFNFLPYITTDEFSLTRIFHELPHEQTENCSFPDFKPGCRLILNAFSSYVLEIYDEFITDMLG